MSQHLTLSDRINITQALHERKPLAQIAETMGKSRSTISREIRKHIVSADEFPPHRVHNRCVYRKTCDRFGICEDKPNCTKKCSLCRKICNSICPSFVEEHCERLSRSPYVCNGCKERHSCVLRKALYRPDIAQEDYKRTLSDARTGYNLSPMELKNIDEQISPLIKNGHSIHHALVVAGDRITVSESTVTRLIKDHQLSAIRLDQQRAVKLKPRKKPRTEKKIDRLCRNGRTYDDYLNFIQNSPECGTVEMDTVIGELGGKSLLTMIFPKCGLMLALLCECHTAACVQHHIDYLYDGLGRELFCRLFPVILTDNGSEFSNPSAIETDSLGNQRTRVFYCNAMASWQKPHVERNHEFIRLIKGKGSSFNDLDQKEVGHMMSHINSYARPSLGDKSPIDVFSFLYGEETLQRLLHLVCQEEISPEKIILKKSLLS